MHTQAAPLRAFGTPAATGADPGMLADMYQRLVVARRYNEQATALAKQGRLAVYPSSTGQEACQVATALAMRREDWLFPTYRDSLAVVMRGVEPAEVLALLRGDWHCGYDPVRHRVAPLCTPLATHCPHAVGLAHAARLAGDDVVAVAMAGDGATSEGDFHEALNFAGVLRAPVVFLVQNNGYAISVPLSRQCAAPTLAHKGAGYGVRAVLADGNDILAMHSVLSEAIRSAAAGAGPTLIEARTYRIDAHTNADDATRYRTQEEVESWRARDPLVLLENHMRAAGLLDETVREKAAQAAAVMAAALRRDLAQSPQPDAGSMFRHVYASPTPQLIEQRRLVEQRG